MVNVVPIISLQNDHVRGAARLKTRKYRDQTGCFLVEGIKILEEALRSNACVRDVFCSEAFLARPLAQDLTALIEASHAKVYRVPEAILKKLTDTPSPQGILGVVEASRVERNHLMFPQDAFVVLCDRVQDPGNLGTIIRVADATGVHAVLLSAASCDLYNPKVIRATMGSLFHLPVIQDGQSLALVRWMQSKGIQVAAASPYGDVACFEVDVHGAIGWVVGHEAQGVSDEVLKACDVVVQIPMPGRAESLNVATAATVLMYEVVRQRWKERSKCYPEL